MRAFLKVACFVAISLPFALRASAQVAPTRSSIIYLPATRETYLKFAGEMDATLRRDVLDVWFPRTLDNDHGGFRANFSRDWKPLGKKPSFPSFRGA